MAMRFGWDSLFDGIYAGDMYVSQGVQGAKKLRKGELLARLIGGLGAPKPDCAIVGDTSSDFVAARECGIRSIGVAWGYGRPDELAMADAVVNDAAEIGA
jgi:phosphoglycolate phosphatase-like HAD superfamily hydrolase